MATRSTNPETGSSPALGPLIFTVTLLITSALVLITMLLVAFSPLGDLLVIDPQLPWRLSRASGTVAYLLLTGSMVWGLMLSSRIVKELTPPPLMMDLHTFISWLALGAAFFHVYMLLFDTYYHYTLLDLLVPFLGPYRPGWVGLGIIGMYFAFVTSASFGWRSWLGQKAWRALHYLTFGAFVLVTAHGIFSGTDSGNLGMQLMYLGSVLLVLFLTNYRLLSSKKANERKSGRPSPPAPRR